MKYQLRKVSVKQVLSLIFLLGLSIGMILFTSFTMFKSSKDNEVIDNPKETVTEVKVGEKSKSIDEYVKSIPEEKFVEEIDINKEVASIVSIEDNEYNAKLFDYETGLELDIYAIIKEDKLEEFNEKIKDLLYLKYPKFIADVLITGDKKNVYYIKENELIIYYYNYVVTPSVNEELYLKVNYNEIKDFLDITVKLDSEYSNEDGSAIDPNKKHVSFTFDDGPSKYTTTLVDILNNNLVHATFFMVGNRLSSFPDTLKKVNNSGNEIGYHSYAHQNFKKQSISEIQSEFNNSNEILKSIVGKTFSLTRPPYGSINEAVKNSIDSAFILWNVDTEDWKYKNVDHIVSHVMNNLGDGEIILFHDMYKTTIESIEILLPKLYVNGYQVVTVSDLAQLKGRTIENHKIYYGLK